MATNPRVGFRAEPEQFSRLERAAQITGTQIPDILRTLVDRHLDAYVAEVAAERQKAIDEFLKGRGA